MLGFFKPKRATLPPVRGLDQGLKRWWMTMTNEEQRDVLIRGATVAVCAVAATVTLPAIGSVQKDKRAEADFRAQAARLAQFDDGGASVRTDAMAPDLLDSPWIRTIEYTLERDPDASLGRYASRERDGAALAALTSFRPEHIKSAERVEDDTSCMAQAIYYESRNESVEGQMAVAEVIANRVKDRRYPDSVCGVVFQGATRTTGCQFTFTCDGAMDRAPRGRHWEQAKTIAAHVMMDLHEQRTGGATHYHATYVDPIWSAGLIKTDRIGAHIFYRFPRGAEWVQARAELKRRRNARRGGVIKAAAPADTADLNAASLSVIKASVSPAMVSTSERSITNGAPRLTGLREAQATSQEFDLAQASVPTNGATPTSALR